MRFFLALALLAANNQTSETAPETTVKTETHKKTYAGKPKSKTMPKEKLIIHSVQPGDTLWNIAMRYDGVTVKQLRKINRLNSNALKVGTKLKVQVDG